MQLQKDSEGPITVFFNRYKEGDKVGTPDKVEVDLVIGAEGANSRVATEMGAGEYDYAIAFQVFLLLLAVYYLSFCKTERAQRMHACQACSVFAQTPSSGDGCLLLAQQCLLLPNVVVCALFLLETHVSNALRV